METHKMEIFLYPEDGCDAYLQNIYHRIYPDNCGSCDNTDTGGGTGTGIVDKYELFIYNSNKQLLQGINSNYIDAFTISVLKIVNDVKKDYIDYVNNKYYIALQVILNQIDLINKYKLTLDDNTRLIAENLALINKPCNCNVIEYTIEPQIGIVANAAIKMEYIIYIQLYGVPDDGIFNPSLLNAIKIEYDL